MTIWQRFRQWRRGRPFWGGLLTLLSGLEIFGSMNLEINGGTITIGQEGFSSYLVVMVLVLCGMLAWFTPQQRHFYGLLAALVAIYSLLGVNLGGFFIGMLLGVAGGGLIFAWTPDLSHDDLRAQPVPDEQNPSEEGDSVEEQNPKAPSPRHAAMMIMVVALSVSMLAVMGAQTQANAVDPCGPPDPAPSATPSPTPSPTATANANATGGGSGGLSGLIGQVVGFFGLLVAEPSASPSPSPTPSPSVSSSPAPCPPGPGGPGTPPGPTKDPGGAAKPKLKVQAAPPYPTLVAEKPSRMTGSRVCMVNLVFDGVFDLPTASGSIRSLKFTMTSSDTNDFLLHVYGKGQGVRDAELHSSKLTVRGGGVEFYTSRFRGNLGPIPVDYTPDDPPPDDPPPSPVCFTNPDIQLVWVGSPALDAPSLRITLV